MKHPHSGEAERTSRADTRRENSFFAGSAVLRSLPMRKTVCAWITRNLVVIFQKHSGWMPDYTTASEVVLAQASETLGGAGKI